MNAFALTDRAIHRLIAFGGRSTTKVPRRSHERAFGILAIGLALGIFVIDAFTPLEGAVAVLYVVVVLISARGFERGGVIITAAACLTMTTTAYLLAHGFFQSDSALLRALVSFAAIAISTGLVLRNQSASEILAEQAALLELTHDPIFVRELNDVAKFWNRAAEDLYGWSRDEVEGKNVHALLRTVFPGDGAMIRAELMRTGRWEGELIQTVRSGSTVTVDSRWSLQRDAHGKPVSVLETNTDISERKHAHAALVASERRYRTIFDTTRVSILQQDWTPVMAALDALAPEDLPALENYMGAHPEFIRQLRNSVTIVDANAVMLRLIGTATDAPSPRTLDEFLPEDEPTFTQSVLALVRGDTFFEGETTILTQAGGRIPILFGITFPKRADGFGCVLVFAVDITERKQAQESLLAVQAELAHSARVATLGELTASIAHEVNQPLASIVTNGEAALRWLRRDVPDLEEASAAVTRLVASGTRAGEIVSRIRAFLTKAPARREWIDVKEMIAEAALLVEREMLRGGVRFRVEVAPDLPHVHGDRVQLQQVVINLMVNAIQAMATIVERTRWLTVIAVVSDAVDVCVTVTDTGNGITGDAMGQVFCPFFTTKADGMGMGLAICRSTVEAHGGRLWASEHVSLGASFSFTIPIAAGRTQ
ncbi:ATP-binding protein [Methylobacterium sp. 77]|uniref:PAS domain-containing sensor histidine kinase n=1 Tax=Methylobacterium sp. 77 TaxID=1101192 RepID=UPI00037943E6|nr:ATP-binding protein [Methylobacterium sp. 77]